MHEMTRRGYRLTAAAKHRKRKCHDMTSKGQESIYQPNSQRILRTMTASRLTAVLPALFVLAALFVACQPITPGVSQATPSTDDAGALIIYSGRSENLVAPLIERFATETGIRVEVRYGDTAEMAATILEEGSNSPADVFFGQDAGALGAMAKAGRLQTLPDALLERVPAQFRSADGGWVGISGRARVLAYNSNLVSPDELPQDVWDLTGEQWRGKVGWAPTNGSFQAFVTALRVLEGDERAAEWLQAMIANDVQPYPNNTAIVDATASGEISAGLVNHYYLYRFLAEQGDNFPARNYFFPSGGAGAMINIAGVGIVDTARNVDAALRFVEYLASPEAQQYFAEETNEYPLSDASIPLPADLPPLIAVQAPSLDLSDLDDLQGTLQMLQEVGALD